MTGEMYKSADLVGALRVGDRVRTNKNNKIVMDSMAYEGFITEVKSPSFWYMEDCNSSYAGWNFEAEDKEGSSSIGQIEILFLDKHGLPNRQSMDEILKLRKIETEVKTMMGK